MFVCNDMTDVATAAAHKSFTRRPFFLSSTCVTDFGKTIWFLLELIWYRLVWGKQNGFYLSSARCADGLQPCVRTLLAAVRKMTITMHMCA